MRNLGKVFFLFLLVPFCWGETALGIEDLFEERSRSVVYLEYYVQFETDRQKSEAVGMVIGDSGLCVFLANTFPDWLPPDQFKDLKIFPAGNPAGSGFEGVYLGADTLNGWNYVQVAEEALEFLTPISAFSSKEPGIGESLWGICLTNRDLDYVPYLRAGILSLKKKLPLLTGFASSEVAAPGGPVFSQDGDFCGWAGVSFPMEYELWIGSEYYRANLRVPDESAVFLDADTFLSEVGKHIPDSPVGPRRPWLGIAGTQPMDEDSAAFLGLEDQGALVVSEVIPETPAAEAGLSSRDILVAIDGETIPRMKPDSALQTFFERAILSKAIGDTLTFEVIRGESRSTVSVVLGTGPKPLREADKRYFKDIGITFREFLVGDALQRRSSPSSLTGMVASFIRPNSSAATAGFQLGDWVLEVDSKAIENLEVGIDVLEEVSANTGERVFLVKRGAETLLLRMTSE